jgi:hypothetical protein
MLHQVCDLPDLPDAATRRGDFPLIQPDGDLPKRCAAWRRSSSAPILRVRFKALVTLVSALDQPLYLGGVSGAVRGGNAAAWISNRPMQKSPLRSPQEKRTKSTSVFGLIVYAENI